MKRGYVQIDQMTPQLVNAGKIRLHNSSDAVEQHFENLHRQYGDALHRLRSHVDDAIDTGEFIRASETVSGPVGTP